MSELKKALESGVFAVTAEMAPPKGWDFSQQLEDAALLRGVGAGFGTSLLVFSSACAWFEWRGLRGSRP